MAEFERFQTHHSRRRQGVFGNIALLFGSMLLCIFFFEFIAFRFIFQPSDVPRNAFIDGLIRYAPEQSGVWRIKDEINAPYSINRQGWNSGHTEYLLPRGPGLGRIVIIGDSYVEALQVSSTASVAEQLERRLPSMEVYRVGISAAPLSQYLLMLEREAVRYAPDFVVIVLAHNDFSESFRFMPGRYNSSFLKVRLEQGHVDAEIRPTPYVPGEWDWVRFSATARYLYYRQQIASVKLPFLPAQAAGVNFQANIDPKAILEQAADVREVTDYLFRRLNVVAKASRVHLVLIMDGDREAIYKGLDSSWLYRTGALALNAMAAEAATTQGIAFIDLHPRFQKDWLQNKQRFNFQVDNHWNERGHTVAAIAIEEYLRSGNRLKL
jgi:GDSL-like Lipase/Acylhydrolase family